MTITDDPGIEFADDAFGGLDPTDFSTEPEPEPEPEPAPAPAPEPAKKKPGPPPNPNSARQRKLAKKAAPAKKATPNAKASPTAPARDGTYLAGARTILGWVARPLAMAGLATQIAAMSMPTASDGTPTPRQRKMLRQAEALSLDSITIAVHGEGLAQGAAAMADSLPWMAQALEKAAKVSPYAAIVEAGAGMVLQVLCNHGFLPASSMLGTLTPEQLRTAAGFDEPE